MPQKTSPFIQFKYGWDYGESGWNTGMDENILKISALTFANVDGIVSSLPGSPINGSMYFLTSDNQLYYAISGSWYFTTVPKWFILKDKASGAQYQFDGVGIIGYLPLKDISDSINSLGSAAYQSADNFASSSEIESIQAYQQDLQNNTSQTKGSYLIGRSVVTLQTISNLVSTVGVTGSSYFVKEYAANTGRGGGYFIWDPNSTSPVNNGTVFSVSGVSTGRYLRVILDRTLQTDWFGIDATGSSDVGVAITSIKTIAENTNMSVLVNNGVYNMGATPIVFDKPIKFLGESKAGVQFNWNSSLASTSGAISVGKNADVVGCRIGLFRCVGSGTGRALDTGSSLTINCKDSLFEDMRFDSFGVGLRQTYSWCNTFKNIRFHNCAKPWEMASQVNATHYDTLSFTNFSLQGTFSNCEGIHFTSANISNFSDVSGGLGFSLFQSSVSMDQPYFENASPILAQVGTNAESLIKSELLIRGGIASGEIRYANGATVVLDGIRQVGGNSVLLNTADVVSPVAVAGDLSRVEGTGVARPSKIPLVDIGPHRQPSLPGAFGGASFSYSLFRDYLQVNQTTANNGIMISSELVVGAQYTLVVEVRKDSGVVLTANNGTGLTLGDDAIPLSTSPWKQTRFIFVANATTLRWQFVGNIQIKSIKLYSGVVYSIPLEQPPTTYSFPSIPTTGTWRLGDEIRNSSPVSGQSSGWICTVAGSPGTWKSTGTIAA